MLAIIQKLAAVANCEHFIVIQLIGIRILILKILCIQYYSFYISRRLTERLENDNNIRIVFLR